MTDRIDPLLRVRPTPGPESGRTYGGETQLERSTRRRSSLMAAGVELFGKHGYADTRVDRLCSLAQVSTRHFYELYPSKEEAFLDVFDHLIATSYEGVLGELERTRDAALDVRIDAAITAYFHPLFSDRRTARIAFVEIVGLSPEAERRRSEYREHLLAIVEAEIQPAVDRGEIRPRDFRFAALSLVGAATVAVSDWVSRGDDRTAEQMRDQLCALASFLLIG